METEIKNAIIQSVNIDTEEKWLTVWLRLDYGGIIQYFGGFPLYIPKKFKPNEENFTGHFIFRCMEIAGVEKWEQMKGKTIRVKSNNGKVEAIGHIVKEDWFNPSIDFEQVSKT